MVNFGDGIDLACVVVGSFAEEFQPSPWFHVNTESKSSRFEIADGLPQYLAWPGREDFLKLALEHPEAPLPDYFSKAIAHRE